MAFILGLPCLLGAFIGANLAFQISPAMMKKAIAVMTLAMLAILMAKAERRELKRRRGP